MRARRRLSTATTVAAAVALLLAACGDAEDPDDAVIDDEAVVEEPGSEAAEEPEDDVAEEPEESDGHADSTADDHAEADSEEPAEDVEEVPDPQLRLVVADAVDPVVHVVDLATEQVLDSFEVAAPGAALYRGSEHRVVAAVQTAGDTVAFLDAGSWAVDHGDHAHYYVREPRLLDASLDTGTPIHVTADFGQFVIFGDDVGSAFLIEEDLLVEEERLDGDVVETGAPHHGGAVLLSPELVVISGPSEGQEGGLADEVWVLHEGEQVGTFACPGLHGEVNGGDWAAFACSDRLLFLEAHGDHAHHRELFYPDELGEDFRLGYVRAVDDSDVFVSSRGDTLVFADADAGELTAVELPAPTATRSTVDDDGNVLVLTVDGILHLFDPATGELVASSDEPVTIDDGDDAPRFNLVGGRDRAYVPSPSEGVVHEFATNDGLRLARTIDLGGAPANLAYLGGWPQ